MLAVAGSFTLILSLLNWQRKKKYTPIIRIVRTDDPNLMGRTSTVPYTFKKWMIEYLSTKEYTGQLKEALRDLYDLQPGQTLYKIYLPTKRALRKDLLSGYKRLNEMARLGFSNEELRRYHKQIELIAEHYKNPQLFERLTEEHGMGHIVANQHGISSWIFPALNEGIAQAYGIRGLLRAARVGEFGLEDVKRLIKTHLEYYKALYPGSVHREGLKVLGQFDPTYWEGKGLTEAAETDRLIAYLDEKLAALRPGLLGRFVRRLKRALF
jgi:hypothetical protein